MYIQCDDTFTQNFCTIRRPPWSLKRNWILLIRNLNQTFRFVQYSGYLFSVVRDDGFNYSEFHSVVACQWLKLHV